MKASKKRRKNRGSLTKGQLNKLIDTFVHPLFKKNQSFIYVDGVLHGLVEQNPPLSMKKFVKYNLPELMKGKGSQQGMRRGKKRRYNCTLSVNGRFTICGHKKAGPWCLKAGFSRNKCPKLIVSYKQRAHLSQCSQRVKISGRNNNLIVHICSTFAILTTWPLQHSA